MRVRSSLLLLTGLLLAQAAWLLAVPAFRGVDEFDHVYRAASVARGEWRSPGEAPADGRGELLAVPRDIVAAAGPECEARPYTGPDNCRAARPAGGDLVLVASGASRYQPVYYWVVGTSARRLHGTSALYAMRVTSGLLCAGFWLLALVAARRWARSAWPVAAVAVAATPVLAYSSVVVAPNALEIVAGLSLWTALSGLYRAPDPATERFLLWAAVPGAVVLATVRTLGLGFLVASLVVLAGVLGRPALRALWQRQRGPLVGISVLVVGAATAALAWILTAAPNRIGEERGHFDGALAGSLLQLPVWVLQTIAAAPGRGDPAPGLTYLLCGGVVSALVVAAFRRATVRLRLALAFVGATLLLGPLVLTLETYRVSGVLWQGRYGMPFGVGLLVLSGLALEQARVRFPAPRVLWLVVVAFATGQVVAVVHVLDVQRAVSPSVSLGLWTPPPVWLVAATTALGWVLVGEGVRRIARSSGAGRHVAVDQLGGELLEEETHVGDDAARL